MLIAWIPVAKKTWRNFTVETDIDIGNVIDDAFANINKIFERMNEWRSKHPRSFINPPKYLKFIVLSYGCIRYEKNKKVMEFNIWLDNGEVNIIKHFDE